MKKGILAWLFLKLVCNKGLVGEDINPEAAEQQKSTEAETSETTEAEGAEPNETEAETTPADPAAEVLKKENKTQKRIDQITREKHEARADAEYWRKVATGEITPQQAQAQPIQQAQQPAGKPAVEQYETYEDFVEALADWRFEQRETAKQTADRTKTVNETYASKVAAAKEQYPDYDEVIESLRDITVANVTIEAIRESEVSAELSYYLGQHIDEARKLQTLSVPAQLKEIGRIEARLEKAPVTTKRISSAPTPIKPTGANDSTKPKNLDDPEVWIEQERKRVAALGRRY